LKRDDPSFGRALWHANKYSFPKMLLCQFGIAAFKLLVPVALGWLIDWFADNEAGQWNFISPEYDGQS